MQTHSSFDIMAETYDADFTNTAIGQLQRKQVWKFLLPVLESYQRPVRILEINCGTGEDALELSRLGHSVTATDGSQMMIEKAKQKAMLLSRNNVRFDVCKFSELHQQYSSEKFDLVISNFGGLNCIDKNNINQLGQQLCAILEDNGKLFLVIMSRLCLWEILYFSLTGKFGKAFRRMKKKVIFNAGGAAMPVFYYSPKSLKTIFSSFTYSRSYPVGLFIPPSYLEKKFVTRQKWLFNLGRLEKKISKYAVLSNLADHFCIIFQKKEPS
jgi:ubiquinone/menaquinone biosynthesis C-methylase UbiE